MAVFPPGYATFQESSSERKINPFTTMCVAGWIVFFEEVRPLLAPNGGPIFMVQVENEYKNIARHYGTDGVAYLEWLRDLFESYDLGVPLSMCNPVAVPLD